MSFLFLIHSRKPVFFHFSQCCCCFLFVVVPERKLICIFLSPHFHHFFHTSSVHCSRLSSLLFLFGWFLRSNSDYYFRNKGGGGIDDDEEGECLAHKYGLFIDNVFVVFLLSIFFVEKRRWNQINIKIVCCILENLQKNVFKKKMQKSHHVRGQNCCC